MNCKAASLFLGLVFACSAFGQGVPVGQKETGLAAVYTGALNHHLTASGQVYDSSKLTAAHKTLPYGTKIRVTNPKNQKNVVVRVNDRGPTQEGRILDLSPVTAAKLGIRRNMMRQVELEVLEVGNGQTVSQHAKK